MKRTLFRPLALPVLLPALMLCLMPLHARATGAAAADVANGYAGEAMEKILANWAAPADRGKVRIVVRVDAEGKVERCGYVEKSASQALNDSVCSAVMKTADLGKPPYGMSQDVYLTFWQGNMADLSGISRRKAAAKPATGTAAPIETTSDSDTVCSTAELYAIPMAKARPPSRFIHKALKELCTASSVRVYPMSKNEQIDVTSQKKSIHIRLSDSTSPNMAPKNTNSMAKKNDRRSCTFL